MIAPDWHGEEAIVVAGDRLTAVVLPRRGGRIASLVDMEAREWLAGPALPLVPRAELPADFVAGDMFGWDECAPTIGACEVDGRVMPDHGELWDREWSVTDDGWLVAQSPSRDYTFRRRISPTAAGLRLDYEATTVLDSLPFLWAAHPQFLAPPGSWVELDPRARVLIDGEDPDLPRLEVTPGFTGIDMVAPGSSRKLFVEPDLSLGRAALVRADGARLTMRWDADVCPYVGIWYDRSEYSREDVLAIEPMTGFFDVCAAALDRDRVLVLRRGEPVRWWVELSVTGSASSTE